MELPLASSFTNLIILPLMAVAQTNFQSAQWLRDPRFEGEPVLGIFDVHRNKSQEVRLKKATIGVVVKYSVLLKKSLDTASL